MKKIKQVKAKLIKTAVIMLVLVAVCIGFYMILSSFSETLAESIQKNEGEIGELVRKKGKIKKRISNSEEAVKFYDEYKQKNGEGDELFKRDTLRTVMVNLKQEMLLNNMEYTLDPFQEIQASAEAQKESAVLIQAKVSMEFDAPSDVIAIKVIKELQNKLPGFLDVIQFEVKKTREFVPQDIVDISSGRGPSVVKCSLSFYWQGIRDKQPSKPKNANLVQPLIRPFDAP